MNNDNKNTPYISVVGGVNIDICGHPFSELRKSDSNPGRITSTLGGVGRNIAHNLSLLESNVHLYTALGEDDNGGRIVRSCRDIGIDISESICVLGAYTSTYLYITDSTGEMAVAVSDMEIYSHITPEYISTKIDKLNQSVLVIADTNIPELSLRYLAQNLHVPFFVDPVSTKKSERIRSILPYIHTLKPNKLEAELLSGVKINTINDVYAAADSLHQHGVKHVFISLGSEGVLASTLSEKVLLPIIPGKVLNTTGCGDAFMAALAWSYCNNLSLRDSAKAALACSSITLESAFTNNPSLNKHSLVERMSLQQ